ncbi:MAG: 4-alpha-glucanotransferase, partial [Clostridia bacterium]
ALKRRFGMRAWTEWPEDIRLRRPEALERCRAELSEDIRLFTYIQYLFFRQWEDLRSYARERGVGIIGDLPIYVAMDSADVWADPRAFQLDERNVPAEVAGVPPDYFTADGQLWGNPLYDWDAMKKDGYSWWVRRIENSLRLYDAVRIDHFRGFSAYWEVPVDKSAKFGEWKKGPGMDLFSTLAKAHPNAAIIAEDLGDIDDDVIKLVKDSGFPGMGVMQFAYISDEDNPHLPHNYTKNTVAYTGTHDNNTILGWLWESNPGSRQYALDYCGFTGDWGVGGPESPVIRCILRTLWRSGAAVTIVPIQDLCGFGGDCRMNKPGVADGNWNFRVTKEALDSIDAAGIRGITELYRRRNPLIKKEEKED